MGGLREPAAQGCTTRKLPRTCRALLPLQGRSPPWQVKARVQHRDRATLRPVCHIARLWVPKISCCSCCPKTPGGAQHLVRAGETGSEAEAVSSQRWGGLQRPSSARTALLRPCLSATSRVKAALRPTPGSPGWILHSRLETEPRERAAVDVAWKAGGCQPALGPCSIRVLGWHRPPVQQKHCGCTQSPHPSRRALQATTKPLLSCHAEDTGPGASIP